MAESLQIDEGLRRFREKLDRLENKHEGVRKRQDIIDGLALDTMLKMNTLLSRLKSSQTSQAYYSSQEFKESVKRSQMELAQNPSFDENCESCQKLYDEVAEDVISEAVESDPNQGAEDEDRTTVHTDSR